MADSPAVAASKPLASEPAVNPAPASTPPSSGISRTEELQLKFPSPAVTKEILLAQAPAGLGAFQATEISIKVDPGLAADGDKRTPSQILKDDFKVTVSKDGDKSFLNLKTGRFPLESGVESVGATRMGDGVTIGVATKPNAQGEQQIERLHVNPDGSHKLATPLISNHPGLADKLARAGISPQLERGVVELPASDLTFDEKTTSIEFRAPLNERDGFTILTKELPLPDKSQREQDILLTPDGQPSRLVERTRSANGQLTAANSTNLKVDQNTPANVKDRFNRHFEFLTSTLPNSINGTAGVGGITWHKDQSGNILYADLRVDPDTFIRLDKANEKYKIEDGAFVRQR